MRKVPFPSLGVVAATLENADYINDTTHAKNCYLLFGATNNEDCYFSQWLWNNRDVVDCTNVFDSERCFDSIHLRKCYNLKYSFDCRECSDSYFLRHCIGCSHCFGCSGISFKKYCLWNEQLSQEEYQRRVAEFSLDSRGGVSDISKQVKRFLGEDREVAEPLRGSEECSGSKIFYSKDCQNSYLLESCRDVSDSIAVVNGKSSQLQLSYGDGSEQIFFSTGIGDNAYDIRYSWECWMNVSELEYCMYCTHGVSQSFGCIGLRKAKHCILNQQYKASEYQEVLTRIKAQMKQNGEEGQFFPAYFSPHAFNQSWGEMFFDLT
jgi:hypothetical protein